VYRAGLAIDYIIPLTLACLIRRETVLLASLTSALKRLFKPSKPVCEVLTESSMQKGRFPWYVNKDSRNGQLRIIDANYRVVMHLVAVDRETAERIVRFMNAEAEVLRAHGREEWLHARPSGYQPDDVLRSSPPSGGSNVMRRTRDHEKWLYT
jgi:hypothetical protein